MHLEDNAAEYQEHHAGIAYSVQTSHCWSEDGLTYVISSVLSSRNKNRQTQCQQQRQVQVLHCSELLLYLQCGMLSFSRLSVSDLMQPFCRLL